MQYFISDLHFYHENILNMDNRGFNNLTDMHEYMIERWNNKVNSDDEVYILGDFSWALGSKTYDLLTRLNGKLYMIEGNHDAYFLDDNDFDDYIFEDVQPYMEIKIEEKDLILSHFPMPFYNHQFQTRNNELSTYMLYGHVHNTYDEYLLHRFLKDASMHERSNAAGEVQTTPFQMINVFCGFSDYQPLSIDEWKKVDVYRRDLMHSYEQQCDGKISFEKWEEFNVQVLNQLKQFVSTL